MVLLQNVLAAQIAQMESAVRKRQALQNQGVGR